MWQRVLVADTAAWWAGRRLVSILVVRGVGLREERLLLGVSGLVGGRGGLASWSQRFSVRTLGIVFQVPAGCRLLYRTLVGDPISITPVRQADARGTQRV